MAKSLFGPAGRSTFQWMSLPSGRVILWSLVTGRISCRTPARPRCGVLADQVGRTKNLSKALRRRGFVPVHDRGRVLVDLAVSIADGVEIISGIGGLGESAELYGPVASVPTAWRCLDEIAWAGDSGRARIARAPSTPPGAGVGSDR